MEKYDRPNWDVVFLIKKLMSTGSTIIFTSARNERHRDVSIKQIVHGCNISMAVTRYSNKGNRLYLRRDGDFRTDDITKKELQSGYAEIVKHALINDIFFFNWLDKNYKRIFKFEKKRTFSKTTYRP